MQRVKASVMVTEPHPRDRRVLTRRGMWIAGTVIVLVAVATGFWRASLGADVGTAVQAALWVLVGTTLMLTVNQVLARRRARRRTHT
jgi:4-amino-4-deoxy-L-arabinose transferase-like glycosyltransferase